MISEELQKKIDRAIKLLQGVSAAYGGGTIEVAYSGGKDSDVILQLAKEANINFRAIYKNTTIDPPGTIKHVRDMGVEILQPTESFYQLIQRKGYPSRFRRWCCQELKEYKVLDKCIMGVRQDESKAREERYAEPTQCRFYNGRTETSPDAAEYHVEAIYPIHNWTDDDVRDFILDRNIKCHPLYYDADGTFHVERRLGCVGCPMAYKKKRIREFQQYPKFVKGWLRFGQKYLDTHPDTVAGQTYANSYEFFVRTVYFDDNKSYEKFLNTLFGKTDCKAFLEEQFGIDLTL